MKGQTKADRVLDYLQKGHILTKLNCWDEIGVLDCSAPIMKLRRDGYPIWTRLTTVKNKYNEEVGIGEWSIPANVYAVIDIFNKQCVKGFSFHPYGKTRFRFMTYLCRSDVNLEEVDIFMDDIPAIAGEYKFRGFDFKTDLPIFDKW